MNGWKAGTTEPSHVQGNAESRETHPDPEDRIALTFGSRVRLEVSSSHNLVSWLRDGFDLVSTPVSVEFRVSLDDACNNDEQVVDNEHG